MSTLDKDVIIVTGKGGTGKTTVTAALGMALAMKGHRTLMVECNGTRAIGPLLGAEASTYTPRKLSPNLHAMTITSEEAIEDFIIKQIKVRALYSMVFKNRIMGPFMDAVPGLHDAVHLGKVYGLVEDDVTNGRPTWDRVVVDAPATGHGLHILNAPKAMMDLTRRGPIFTNSKLVHDLTSDRSRTGIVMTCLPEAMPVSESLHLNAELARSGYGVTAVVLNEVIDAEVPDVPGQMALNANLSPDQRAGADALIARFSTRNRHQHAAHQTLSGAIDAPIVQLPLLFDRPLTHASIEVLASRLLAKMESA